MALMRAFPLPMAAQTVTMFPECGRGVKARHRAVSRQRVQESTMFTRIHFLVVSLLACSGACAQDLLPEAELAPGTVRQLNTTQAHLKEMQPNKDETPRRANAPVVARLLGKMLSAHVKGLNLELSSEQEPSALGMQDPQGAVRLNRRAEIAFDNYRFGIQRGGVVMRYEMTF